MLGRPLFRRRKNVIRRQVFSCLTNNLQHHLTLPRQTQILNILHKALSEPNAYSQPVTSLELE